MRRPPGRRFRHSQGHSGSPGAAHDTHFSLDRLTAGAYKETHPQGGAAHQQGDEMTLEGYVEYQRREFCKDVKCPVQTELMTKPEGSEEYERLRQTCRTDCRYTTWQFHHWLIDKGYLIVRPADTSGPREG